MMSVMIKREKVQFFDSQCTTDTMYAKSTTSAERHKMSNYCRIQPEGLLHDTEGDLLAIDKFLVLPAT